MESPMRRTRGKLVSLACEIQISHHSMDSCNDGAKSGGAPRVVRMHDAPSNKVAHTRRTEVIPGARVLDSESGLGARRNAWLVAKTKPLFLKVCIYWSFL